MPHTDAPPTVAFPLHGGDGHYTAIADTHARGRVAIDELREERERLVKTAASLSIERRILREDFRYWAEERRRDR